MKKLTALILALVMALSTFGAAFAEEKKEFDRVQFEPTLTRLIEDGMKIGDAEGWMSSDLNVAMLAVLLVMDAITPDIEIDVVDYYEAKDAYVGMNENGVMTAVYCDGVSSYALILTYQPGKDYAHLTCIDMGTVVTDTIMSKVMQDTCVKYSAVDHEAAQQVLRMLLDALNYSGN